MNGKPIESFEQLLAALDAAAKRYCCRLPVVIDGLNEAENPKDWKAPLASLEQTVKSYPNVLVICTLRTGEHKRKRSIGVNDSHANTRESFAVMALPMGIRRIESEGFGADTEEAIAKYFLISTLMQMMPRFLWNSSNIHLLFEFFVKLPTPADNP